MNWTAQIVAFVPNLLWLVGNKLVGDKRRVGWCFLFGCEFAWVAAAVVLRLWSILPWCAVGFAMYARNYRKWAP